MKKIKGFTLVEILVVIAIISVISGITFYFFGNANDRQVLEKNVSGVTSLIRNARLLSVASKNASVFGIHFESDKAVLFEGSSYSAGSPFERIIDLSREVYIPSYSLNGGGSDVVFSRLVGETINYGTVTISLKDNSTSTVITILKTGVIQ